MTTPAATTDVRTYPGTEYVRTIDFVDAVPDHGTDPPVHVTSRVRINGEDVARHTGYPIDAKNTPAMIGLRIRNDVPVMVTTGGGLTQSEVLVSFLIHADDVTVPDYDAPPSEENWPRIGRLRCLIRPGEDAAYRWERVEEHGQRWVRVWLQVREVRFIGRPDPAPVDAEG